MIFCVCLDDILFFLSKKYWKVLDLACVAEARTGIFNF
jgi:hypothetical protein